MAFNLDKLGAAFADARNKNKITAPATTGASNPVTNMPVTPTTSATSTQTTAKTSGQSSSSTPVVNAAKVEVLPKPNSNQTPTVNSTPSFNGVEIGGNNTPVRYSNQYLEDANKLMSQLNQMINTPFTFTAEDDPTYQAAQKLAQAGAKTATRNALETMNDRGIINSSVTSSQLGQIEQEAELKPLELIPQLQQNAYSQRQQGITDNYNMMNTLLSAGQNQQAFAAQLPMQEAALTGQYLSGEAQDTINQILALKTKAETAGTTKEQKTEYSKQAEALRNKLSTFGVDPSMFGSGVNLSQASKNMSTAGKLTTEAQSSLLNTLLGLGQTYGSLPKGTGTMAESLPMYSGLSSMLTSLEGKPTSAQQAQTFNQNLAAKDQSFNQNMATKTFDLNVEKFNFDKTTQANQTKIAWAQQSLQEAKFNQDTDYQNWLKSNQMTETQGLSATNGYMTQLMAMGSRENAMSYIVENAQSIIGDGANVSTLMASIDAIYPAAKQSETSGLTQQEINSKALSAAQSDIRWFQAKTEAERNKIVNEYKSYLSGN